MAEEVRIARLLLGLGPGRRRARRRLRAGQLHARVRARGGRRRASWSGSTPRGRCSPAARRSSQARRPAQPGPDPRRRDRAAVPRRRLRRPSAASRPCTCSPIRSRRSTRCGGCSVPGGRIAIMTSVRRQLTLPPLKPLIERASGMRVFESDEIVGALQERGFENVRQRLAGPGAVRRRAPGPDLRR